MANNHSIGLREILNISDSKHVSLNVLNYAKFQGISEKDIAEEIQQLFKEAISDQNIDLVINIAYVFHDWKVNESIPLLIDAMSKKFLKGYRGTIVYCCENLDASNYINFFTDILFSDTYEVDLSLDLVFEGMNNLSSDDIFIAIEKINNKQAEELKKGLIGEERLLLSNDIISTLKDKI